MSDVLKPFGRYFLLDHLAQGGMAEIYRARVLSPDGAGRILVIKKIQSHFDENSEFLQMFKSEIKVTLAFNHPNIVQVYDFGEEDQQPYIAMELVDGKNLRQLMNRFLERKETFPIELATYIIEQAAAGLHYAHSFKDKITGEPLHIIHRDISPQNILISYEGIVKVIDFGIAKATTNQEHTRAGVIKGKPSYLSPEQISGDSLDSRSDLFSLGIVLWEMLAGRKLFAGENDLAVLKQIEAAQTHVKPPSQWNEKIPKELDYIVLKSLAKSREKRYQTGEQFQRALHKFLYQFLPDFNPNDLSRDAKNLFKPEIIEDRKKIQNLSEQAERALKKEASSFLAPEKQKKNTLLLKPTTMSQEALTLSKTRSQIQLTPLPPSPPLGAPSSIQEEKQSTVYPLLLAAGLVLLVGLGILNQTALTSFVKQWKTTAPTEEKPHQTDASATFPIKIQWTPGGGQPALKLNGKPLSAEEPLAQVPLNTPLELSLERERFKPVQRSFSLTPQWVQNKKEWVVDLLLEPLQYGFLSIQSQPSATLSIFIERERPWVQTTPLETTVFPVGTYRAELKNDTLGLEKEFYFTVEEGKNTRLSENLEMASIPRTKL